jgi:small-conductance mechanosensitive channel
VARWRCSRSSSYFFSVIVTNWTLSDQRRTVEIAVKVAPGTDLQHVAKLLKSAAADHPDVVKEPVPKVHVLDLAASAINFQLRVWNDRPETCLQLRRDLSVAINDALANENIALV